MGTRLIYVDDSGARATGHVVYGWVEVNISDWSRALRVWLDWRQDLYRTIGIPADYELHATKFVGGRGRPTGTPWDARIEARSKVVADTLAHIARLPGVRVGAAYTTIPAGQKYGPTQVVAYAEIVRWIDSRLSAEDDYGLVVVDGDGTDPSYRVAHRELALDTRAIIEDPFFHAAHANRWVQLSDLVAYTAYMHIARLPNKEHAWPWWKIHLGLGSVTGPEPLKLLE